MKFLKTAALIAGTAFAVTGPSSAATTFNLGCGGGVTCDSPSSGSSNVNSLSSSFSETKDGLTVTATAKSTTGIQNGTLNGDGTRSYTGLADFSNEKIGRFVGGAGVFSSVGDAHTLDGSGVFDLIELTFDKAVSITDIAFGYFFNSNDFFGVFTDLGGDGLSTGQDILSAQTAVANSVSTGSTLFSKTWGIVAFTQGSSFKLSAITVEEAPSTVPLPAGGLLLLSGLAGLGFARRRKAK